MTVGWSALDIALTDQAGQVLGIEADTRARRWPLRLAWTLAAVDLALLALVLALALLNRHAPDVWKLADPFQLVTAVVYGVVGGLLAARRSGNTIGWLFLAIGLLAQLGALAAQWAVYALETRPGVRGGALMLWVFVALAGAVLALTPSFALLLVPTGRLVNRSTRNVAGLASLPTLALPLFLITGTTSPPGFSALIERTANPLALSRPLGDPGIAVAAGGIRGLASIVLLLLRLRAARGPQRRQYTWVVAAMGLMVMMFVADFAARASGSEAFVVTGPALGLAAILAPVSMGAAILRYHLWDINIIISRTLIYLSLSACVVAIYVFVVGWLGTVFQTGSNLFFSLLATGVVAVLFQPLREQIQRVVNLRMYGERDEPYTAISRLGRRL